MKEGMIEGVSGPAKIFGYAVPLAFLVGGLLLSLQTGAMGAGLAITGFKTSTKWMGRETRRGVERGLKVEEGAERLGRWTAGKPFLGIVSRPLLSYAKRRKEELKKELEGVPFRTQAAMTGKSVQDVVRGLGPREFAEKVRPDDINLETFMAMSQRQVITTGQRGKPEIVTALRNLTLGLKNSVALQKEYLNLERQGKHQEADRLYRKTLYVESNPNYQP